MRERVIIEYIALDGVIFRSKRECLRHEQALSRVTAIMEPLGARPNDGNFLNGAGYLQHDLDALLIIKKALITEARKHIDCEAIKRWAPEDHPSWAGRAIDEGCPRPLYTKGWFRICCIDKYGREWGQPYYADHPDDVSAVKKRLN